MKADSTAQMTLAPREPTGPFPSATGVVELRGWYTLNTESLQTVARRLPQDDQLKENICAHNIARQYLLNRFIKPSIN